MSETRPTASLKPHPRNSRRHSDDQIVAIARGIEAFGWTQPIAIDEDGTVLIGHGRLEAAKSMGLDEVPVVVMAGLSDEQKRGLIIADNRLAEQSSWDKDVLQEELRFLLGGSFDLTLTGFDLGEVRSIREPKEPEAQGAAVTAVGEVWRLGHSLIAVGGQAALGALLTAAEPIAGAWGPGGPSLAIIGPDLADGDAQAVLEAGCPVIYWWAPVGAAAAAGEALEAASYEVRAQIVAMRERSPAGGRWRQQHSCAWYAVRKGRTASWRGLRDQTTLWHVGEEAGLPLECIRRPLVNHLAPQRGALMAGVGDGNGLIAAASCGRAVYAFEEDPHTVDAAIRRWQAYTGLSAVEVASGEGFGERVMRQG